MVQPPCGTALMQLLANMVPQNGSHDLCVRARALMEFKNSGHECFGQASAARDFCNVCPCCMQLEGTVSSLDKRLKVQLQENQALKVRTHLVTILCPTND